MPTHAVSIAANWLSRGPSYSVVRCNSVRLVNCQWNSSAWPPLSNSFLLLSRKNHV